MPTLIKIIRLFFALIAIWQLFGLLPALSWLPDLPSIGSEVWALLMIKVGALVISAAIYFALRAIGKRYPASGAGPSDAKIIVATVIAIPVLGFVAAVVTPMLAGNDRGSSGLSSQITDLYAGWFGPDNFDDCVLEKMKGQDNSMMRSAQRACEQVFPHVRRLYEYENNTVTEWNTMEGKDGLVKGINLWLIAPNDQYRIVRVVASFSEKDCGFSYTNDYKINAVFEFKPGELSSFTAINPFQKPKCMSGNKQIYGIFER